MHMTREIRERGRERGERETERREGDRERRERDRGSGRERKPNTFCGRYSIDD